MATVCTPKSLAAAAQAFSGYDRRRLQVVKSYLFCQVAKAGLTPPPGGNIVPPGSSYPASGIAVFNLTVLANTTYQITWGANDQSMTMGSETYVGGGAGSKTIVYTNGNTNMAFLGTANGTLVTVVVQPAPKAVPVPGDFTWVADSTFTHVVATWDAPPSNVTKTELWTSTDNITFTLNQTIAAPGTTASVPLPAVGSTIYAKVRWYVVVAGAFSGVLQYLNTDWVTRVNNNGGAAPSNAIKKAVNDFYNRLGNVGILSNMSAINPMGFGGGGAGSLITMSTPLIKGTGSDPWGNHNLVNGSTGVNGLSPATAGWLQTGFIPSAAFASINNSGQSIYIFNAANDGINFIEGCWDGANSQMTLQPQNTAGNTVYALFSSPNKVTVATPGSGFYSINRVSATDLRLFFGNGTTPTAQVGSVSALGAGALTGFELYIGALNDAGAGTLSSGQTVSFWCAHTGLSITQADLLKQAVQAMRVAMGGGFV
jgi:hypothetical protein